MRREIDERTLERAEILMTNISGQEELDKTAVFWEASLDRPNIARKIVDAGEVIRGEKTDGPTGLKSPISKIARFGASAPRPSAG